MRRAFTLIELLVVIGIIALLVAILLPMLARAKAQSARVTCRAQLREIGAAFVMYLSDSKDRLPAVNTMPSVVPSTSDAPSIVKVLQPYIKSANKVWHCPADQITKPTPNAPSGFDTYFEREGSSYQYNPFLTNFAGHKAKETLAYTMGHPELMTVMSEYEAFHGPAGKPGSTNYLYGDMHVGALGD